MSKRASKRHPRARRAVAWAICACVLWGCVLLTLCSAFYLEHTFTADASALAVGQDVFPRSPKFYSYRFTDRTARQGEREEVTAAVYAQKQTTYVPYDQIPKDLVNAFIAIEDKRFFEHEGVDWYRTVAACADYLFGGKGHFGGSSITQQLVKNLTGDAAISWRRKLQEILYARDLERRLDKTQILELYLNVIHFSDQCDGIAAAAEHYFSKSPQQLTTAECATIAAITNNPSYYNPIRNPQNNLARRNLILSQMHEQGYLSKEEFQSAVESALELRVDASSYDKTNSWYTDMVIEDVIGDLCTELGMSRAAASHLVYTGGLQIEMAMDLELQSIVEDHYRTAVRMPKNEKGEVAQSAMIVIDPHTGDVLAVAGAVGVKGGNRLQNFATQTKRSPGSTIKPLTVYAPALEEGLIHWASVYDDVPLEFDTNGRGTWPKNANGIYRGLTNVAYAVAHSTNTVALRVLEELGMERAMYYGREKFGLPLVQGSGKSDLGAAALGLGQLNYGVTLRELTAAYTPFADAGVYHSYRSYFRVLDSEGTVLLAKPDGGSVALSTENAAIMTKLLQGVVERGTSSSVTLQSICECAGKTGTTNNDHDRWFIGYTPDYICGVWCGYEYPSPLEGKNLCTQIWNTVMRQIVSARDTKKQFSIPNTVVQASYCRDSGMLPDAACALDPRGERMETGWFRVSDRPHAFCTCHVLCESCTEEGGICHGFCPPEARTTVGLIRVERTFPKQIYVSDAQYVLRTDPNLIPPNPDPKLPYDADVLKNPAGISRAEQQYNRSCTEHTEERDDLPEQELEEEFEDGEIEFPMPWNLPFPYA